MVWRGSKKTMGLAAAASASLLAGCLAACSNSGSATVPAGTTFAVAAHAAPIPVTSAERDRATQGADAFALSLLRELGSGDGDLTFSPQTLADLLAMLAPGARGQTAAQLTAVLGADGLTSDQLAAALGSEDAVARADAKQGSITLRESSDLWAAKSVKPSDSYLSTLGGAFGTGVHQVDFAANPGAARDAVNQLVSQETNGYIPELFSPGDIDSQTRMVLTDAVYLDAAWASPFDPAATNSSGTFTRADGSTESAALMSRTGTFRYASGSDWQLAELPYQGGRLAMDVLLPAAGRGSLDSVRARLTGVSLTSMLGSLRTTSLQLTLPRFTTDSSLDTLVKVLKRLGVTDLFDPSAADLSGVTANKERLFVSAMVAKAHIAVGEKGTVAAAAAGAAEASSGRMAPNVSFTADHPFLYLVRDLTTGRILFLGQEGSV